MVLLANGGVAQCEVALVFRQGDLAILVGVGFIEGYDEGIENQRAGLRFRKGNLAASRGVDLAEILGSATRGHELRFGDKAVAVGIIHREGIGNDQVGSFRAAHRAIAILVGSLEFLLGGRCGSRCAAGQEKDWEES